MSIANATDRVGSVALTPDGVREVRMVEETFEPSMTVSLVAPAVQRASKQLFMWHRLVAGVAGSGEESCWRRTDCPDSQLASMIRSFCSVVQRRQWHTARADRNWLEKAQQPGPTMGSSPANP